MGDQYLSDRYDFDDTNLWKDGRHLWKGKGISGRSGIIYFGLPSLQYVRYPWYADPVQSSSGTGTVSGTG